MKRQSVLNELGKNLVGDAAKEIVNDFKIEEEKKNAIIDDYIENVNLKSANVTPVSFRFTALVKDYLTL
ncbi:hypothetical protein D3C87_1942770 [compost metagenome]